MAKQKSGLHKEISSIFDGVPISKNGVEQPSNTPAFVVDYAQETQLKPPPPPVEQAPATPKQPQPKYMPPEPTVVKEPVHRIDAESSRQVQVWWQEVLRQIKDKLAKVELSAYSPKQIATTALMPVLFIILIFALIPIFRGPVRGTSKLPSFEPTASPDSYTTEINWEIPPPLPENLRDPMKISSGGSQHLERGKLIVKGIVYSKDKPSAIIGTQIVFEGDKVSGANIIKINEDTVEFEMDGKRWEQRVQR